MANLLYGVTPTDCGEFAAVSVAFMIVASWRVTSARRATKVDRCGTQVRIVVADGKIGLMRRLIDMWNKVTSTKTSRASIGLCLVVAVLSYRFPARRKELRPNLPPP